MPRWGTIIWPWDMALHVKSANAIRSLRDGSSVMPANRGPSTRCVSAEKFRCFNPSAIGGVTPSIERSKSLDEVLMRQRKKRKPSTMPTERSVGKR